MATKSESKQNLMHTDVDGIYSTSGLLEHIPVCTVGKRLENNLYKHSLTSADQECAKYDIPKEMKKDA